MAEIPYETMNIQWFPGHMTKAKREMQESLQLVDVVCEILDARIPYSSRNPEIDDLRGDKPKLVLLNRTDLADPQVTEEWIRYWEEQGIPVLPICGKTGKNINRIVPEVKKLISDKLEAYKSKGQTGRTIRIMILGIPNVGKSTVINQLAHRKVSAVGNRPGVTRAAVDQDRQQHRTVGYTGHPLAEIRVSGSRRDACSNQCDQNRSAGCGNTCRKLYSPTP